eukprot:359821-Chlamydomonas_euryale.AAC.8
MEMQAWKQGGIDAQLYGKYSSIMAGKLYKRVQVVAIGNINMHGWPGRRDERTSTITRASMLPMFHPAVG